MVMQSIGLVDEIEIERGEDGLITLDCDVPELSTGRDNLIIRSAHLLREKFGFDGLGARLGLKKSIPIGAGLAGGSSNAAAALVGLNELWGLGASMADLETLCSELGSDVPFCLDGGTQLCFGRGELLEPQPKRSLSLAIVLVKNPSVSVSTPWAYGRFKEIEHDRYLTEETDFEFRRQLLRSSEWLSPLGLKPPFPLRNDLQNLVSESNSSVKESLRLLREMPKNLGVAMSGSGPSCFALFPSLEMAESELLKNKDRLEAAGLMSWCCSLRDEGVRIETD